MNICRIRYACRFFGTRNFTMTGSIKIACLLGRTRSRRIFLRKLHDFKTDIWRNLLNQKIISMYKYALQGGWEFGNTHVKNSLKNVESVMHVKCSEHGNSRWVKLGKLNIFWLERTPRAFSCQICLIFKPGIKTKLWNLRKVFKVSVSLVWWMKML